MIEDGWADEITFVEPVPRCARSAANEFCTIFASDIDVIQHSLELDLIDARPHLSRRIRSGTDSHRLCAFCKTLNKFVCNLVHHDCATRLSASLPRRSKRARGGRFHCQILVRHSKNHDRILSTQLAL